MKAVVLTQTGGVENFEVQEIPTPGLKDNEVLIQSKAISINPVDTWVRSNPAYITPILKLKPGEGPIILGWDIAGIVTEVGKSVTKFKKGDAVFGMINFTGHGKAYAEYVVAPESQLALKPENVSFEDAAAATLTALTALLALVNYAQVKKDDKVLIHSAAGGVGHYAVQIAKHAGAHVIGTSSAANKDFVLSLGADEHIDYAAQRFEDVVQDADIVLDGMPTPDHVNRSLDAVKPGGTLVPIVVLLDHNLKLAQKARTKKVFMHRLGVEAATEQDIETVATLLASGAIRSHVSRTFAFPDVAGAHKAVETGHTRGKVLVTF